MASVKLTKNELKKQKDDLKQFERYLPTLQLKKQQLQIVIMQVDEEYELKKEEYAAAVNGLDDWVAVFSENTLFSDTMKIENLVKPEKAVCTENNIAGVFVPTEKVKDEYIYPTTEDDYYNRNLFDTDIKF